MKWEIETKISAKSPAKPTKKTSSSTPVPAALVNAFYRPPSAIKKTLKTSQQTTNQSQDRLPDGDLAEMESVYRKKTKGYSPDLKRTPFSSALH
jgi:hypothetical protein